MRVAYSCAGEGFGHAARMVAMSNRLENRHDVTYFAPSTVNEFLSGKMPGRSFMDVPVLPFVKRRDRIDLPGTVLENLPTIIRFPAIVRRLAKQLRERRIQAVISDFEPFLAWAARAAGIPVFQFNHPGIVAKCISMNPHSWIHALFARLVEGPWNSRVHISFYHGDIGPLFRKSLFRHPPTKGDYLLVNLTKDGMKRAVSGMFASVCPSIPVRFFPSPGEDFEKAFTGCRAVLSTAGHQIIAESLALGKPVLVIPQKGQWEQEVNARMLVKTGRGMATTLSRLSRDLPRFMASLSAMEETSVALPMGFTIADGSRELDRRINRFLARRVSPRLRIVPKIGSIVTGVKFGESMQDVKIS